jgi:citrate synthase
MRKENKMADKPSKGLADVIAASTAVSDIDGRAGLLFYRGYDIHQLAGPATFEEIAVLLQRGHAPSPAELAAYRAELAGSRMAGWTAHVIGQHADNRLIRPDSEYIGERGLTWVPVGRR